MPVRATKSGKKFIIVETATGKRAKNAAGTPVDGEGHSNMEEAQKQAAAINISLKKKGKI
jgi:hypothetical protein